MKVKLLLACERAQSIQSSRYVKEREKKVEPWSQGWLMAAGAYPGFCSMKRLEEFLLPPERDSEGAVASWLVRLTPERAVRVRALAGDIVLCSWARHFTLTVPLSTQAYKWVPANLMLGVTLRWTSIPSRGE